MRLTQIERYTRPRFTKTIYVSIWFLVVCVFFALGTWYWYTHTNTAHPSFPLETDILIPEGSTQNEITEILEDAHVVRSSLLLHMVLTRKFKEDFVQAGTYRFPEAFTTHGVAEALTQGTYRSPLVTVTLPEGFRIIELLKFLPESFAQTELPDETVYEGTLFPDTYFFSESVEFGDIIATLTSAMEAKLAPYADEIAASPFTQDEVLILASILEREANDETSMKLVSGILQNRLKLDMPLQVDATLDYLLGKTSAELTLDDLEIDSAFNTYEYTGLPPHPIANPGITAIEAVLRPTESEYLYYLTGDDGTFYYAETFEAHKENKTKYIE